MLGCLKCKFIRELYFYPRTPYILSFWGDCKDRGMGAIFNYLKCYDIIKNVTKNRRDRGIAFLTEIKIGKDISKSPEVTLC